MRANICMGALLMVMTSLIVPAAKGATASWEFDRSEFYFAPAPYGLGPTEPHVFTLTNTGETQLMAKTWGFKWSAVAAWLGEGPRFQVISSGCQDRALEPGESCSVEVAFDPLHAGWVSATLMFKSQNGEVPYASVTLRGEGTGLAIPVTPDHLAFGPVSVGTTSLPQTITLEGQSTTYAYRLEDISLMPPGSLPPSSSPFQIVGGSCQKGLQLGPGETCTIEVAMMPTEVGSFRLNAGGHRLGSRITAIGRTRRHRDASIAHKRPPTHLRRRRHSGANGHDFVNVLEVGMSEREAEGR